MAVEMYLQKCTHFHGGEYIGADVEGNLYKDVVALMIQGLKKSISFVIKALPETMHLIVTFIHMEPTIPNYSYSIQTIILKLTYLLIMYI